MPEEVEAELLADDAGGLEHRAEVLGQALERLENQSLVDDEVLAKVAEIQRLMDQIADPELRDAFKRLAEQMANMDRNEVQKALNDLTLSHEELLQNLERTLEMLKQVQLEEKLERAVQQAEEMAERQDRINQELGDMNRKEEGKGEEEAAAAEAREVQDHYTKFRKAEANKEPIKAVYLSLYLFAALLILFGAVWLALYLARRITEHASRSGEHYVTASRAEYSAMFRAAAGAGLIVGVMALLKILAATLGLPGFWQAVAFSLIYGLGFVVVHILHLTIATKQPAMTAATIAAALDGSVYRVDPTTGDLDFTNEYAHYGLLERGDLAMPTETGLRRSIFAIGPAVVWAPGTAMDTSAAAAGRLNKAHSTVKVIFFMGCLLGCGCCFVCRRSQRSTGRPPACHSVTPSVILCAVKPCLRSNSTASSDMTQKGPRQ